MNKLVTVIMGQDCEQFINMSIQAIQDSDAIVYLDGGSKDQTLNIVHKWKEMANNNFTILSNEYDQDDPKMNGIQRNTYLNYVKERYPDYWCLVIDADEIVEDINKIKKIIDGFPEGIYSVKMRHLVGDLAHEDAVSERHFVPNRLFKISVADKYPEVEHPVLEGKKGTKIAAIETTTIWHLAYVPNMWTLKQRYDNQVKKSNMHTPQFLKNWYWLHLFGEYPVKKFNPAELPKILLDSFGIDKDELYFTQRNVELKHAVMVKQWHEYFQPKSILELGAGKGCYLYFWEMLVPEQVQFLKGIELSEFAVKNQLCPEIIVQGDITEEEEYEEADLITAIDVLEHLDEIELNKTIDNMIKYSKKRILISVPVIGDENLYKDSTHRIFKTKDEWIKLFIDKKCKQIQTPKDWLFHQQLFIFDVSNVKENLSLISQPKENIVQEDVPLNVISTSKNIKEEKENGKNV